MTTALPKLEKLKPNPHWAKLPLFNRKNWSRVRFDDIVENVNERVEPSTAAEAIYVGLDDLDSGSLHIRRWGKGSDVIGTKLGFRKGDVIFGRRRAYQRKLAVAEVDGICSAHAMVARAKPKVILPEFLPFLMMSDKFMNRAVDISVGSLSPTINWTTLKLEEFDLPPLDQQRRIAEILWAVDAVLQNWIDVEKRFEELRMSYAVEAYGLLQKSEKTNHQKPLSELVEINPSLGEKLSDDTDVSFITMADVSEAGKVVKSETRKYKDVKKGFTTFRDRDVLFAKITPCMENGKGALVTGLVNGIGFGSTEFHVLRPKLSEDEDFVFHLTKTPQFRCEAKRFMRGSAGQQRVPSEFLSNFVFLISDQKRRLEIGKTLKDMTHQIEQLASLQTNVRAITTSMLTSFFGG